MAYPVEAARACRWTRATKTGSGTSRMRPAKASTSPGASSGAAPTHPRRPSPQTRSIAKDGSPYRSWLLLRLAPSFQFVDQLFRFPNVRTRQLARFHQVRHHCLRSSAKHPKEIVKDTPSRFCRGNRRLVHVGISDLPDTAQGASFLQAVDRALHARVGRPFLGGKRLLNLANGETAVAPEFLHDTQF